MQIDRSDISRNYVVVLFKFSASPHLVLFYI